MEKRILPEFSSEAEEARWWFDNQAELDADFERAAADGELSRGTVARRAGIPTGMVPLDPEDMKLATELAEKRGVQYQTYVKTLVHEALLRESKAL